MTNTVTTYLAIGPHYWGRGNTRAEAERNMRKASGTKRTPMVALYTTTDPEAHLDIHGRLCWHQPHEAPELVWERTS